MQNRKFLTRSFSVILILILTLPIFVSVGLADKTEIRQLTTFLRVTDYSGEKELAIKIVYLNDQSIDHYWKTGVREQVQKTIGERDCFLVVANPFKDTYFYPTQIQFTQNRRQYNVDYDDLVKITETFSGQLRKDTTVAGLVFIPDRIDVYSEMKIHYDEHSATFSVPEVDEKSVEERIEELEEKKKELELELEEIKESLSGIENKLKELRNKQDEG